MDLQRPTYIDPNRGPGSTVFGGFDAAGGGCSPITYAIVGAVAMYAIPPLLGGFFSGIREAWQERDE
jgi:hypothetical protein